MPTPTIADAMPSNSSEADVEEDMEEDIHELARPVTSTMSHAVEHDALFPKPSDEALNPKSPTFDARKWASSFYTTQTETLHGHAPNTASLAFRNLNVLVCLQSGEMFCVLGPPGSGCSTLLKIIASNIYGFNVADGTTLNYQGISSEDIHTAFQGESIYTAEVDHHFPKLTVGETLYFAARARCPQNPPHGISKHDYAEHLRDVVMAMLGISHTKNTRVGHDFIGGVSGGERKRVSIAEAVLSYSPWQCWDNSTRGLDSANAIEFCRTLRLQSDVFGRAALVAIYQTAPDFLTSMTSAATRTIQPDWKVKAPPRTPDEFAQAWKASVQRQSLDNEIDQFQAKLPLGGEKHHQFHTTRRAQKSKFQRS
ncbi:hypothetical protein FSARC_4298 [Fusarium sarcochroum]|uniref:ABC transporter domain-containing protein n=1 Tax=Fusarium sarcochroum TaxID=1208366 RepID=A0A8H4U2A2_9HYPO|nr:hypothetical protein FSARC_4298 [Fusarium sarcochroum]